MLDVVVACMALLLGSVFVAAFLVQRTLHRRRKRGFYPTGRDLGNALHTLQIMAVPKVEYVMQVKRTEPKEQQANGDGED